MPRQRTVSRKSGPVFIANESGVTNINGKEVTFYAGLTRVYEDDEIYQRMPDYFDLLDDHIAVHQNSMAPQ